MESFRLAGRLVEPSLNRIDGAQIEPKVMQVLVALASHPGDVVTRDELMTTVWAGVFVTEDVLNRAIREIRRVFGDDAESPRVVETIRKRGYRLVAVVEPVMVENRRATSPSLLAWMPRPLAIAALLVVATLIGAFLVWIGIGRGGSVATEAHMRFVPLTTDPGNEVSPALSPDGQRLAYVARGTDGRARVFVKPTTGGPAVQITHGDGRETAPAWSADGSRLAFARIVDSQDAGRPGLQDCTIRIADSHGEETREIGPCGWRESLKMAWSPDGRSLAIAERAPCAEADDPCCGADPQGCAAIPSRIALVDVAAGTRRPLTDPVRGTMGDESPAFSPDGRQVAFVRSSSGAIGDVFVVNVSGGAPVRVTHDNGDVLGVEWEPDGRHLVFSSDRGGGINLYRVDADGGEPMLVTGGGAKLKHPSVARTGAIAYENWHYDINIDDVSLPDGSRRAMSPTTDQWNFHPQLSPDGSRIAFQSTRSGPYEIWVADRDGGRAVAVTSSGGYKSMPRWSPDGRSLVFVARPNGVATLTVVDVGTREARAIATDAGGIAAPSFTHDGSGIYFGSQRSGSWQVWMVRLADRAAQQVTKSGGYAALESTDGKWLYFSRLDRRGLSRQPIHGGAEQVIAREVAPEDWANWGVIDDGVFFISRPDDDDPVLMIAEEGRAPHVVTRLVAHAWSGVAMSRDARHVLYAHADHRDANIVGIEFVR